jgi:hypothetical protein
MGLVLPPRPHLIKPGAFRLNRNHPLAEGLGITIPLFEGAGAPKDYSPSGGEKALATAAGTPTWGNGPLGLGRRYAAAADTLAEVGPNIKIASTPHTVVMWLSLDNVATARSIYNLSALADFSNPAELISVSNVTSGRLSFFTPGAYATSGVPLANGKVFCAARVWDATNNWQFYQDGVRVGTSADTNTATATGANLYLGTGFSGSMTGNYIQFLSWPRRALTPSEIWLLAEQPFALWEPLPSRTIVSVPAAAPGGDDFLMQGLHPITAGLAGLSRGLSGIEHGIA